MNIKNNSKNIALVFCAAMALPAAASPRLISANEVRPVKTTFSLFMLSPKITVGAAVAQTTVQARLDAAGEGVTACFLTADVNQNNINCGVNGVAIMRLGPDFFSTTVGSNHAAPLINWLPEDSGTNVDRTTVEFGVNSRTPLLATSPIEASRPFQVRFNKRVAQFGFLIDPYTVADPTVPATEGKLLEGLQFIVNGKSTPMRSFAANVRGDIPFVGVEDPEGFTEVTIIGSGLGSIKPDRYTVVQLTNF